MHIKYSLARARLATFPEILDTGKLLWLSVIFINLTYPKSTKLGDQMDTWRVSHDFHETTTTSAEARDCLH